MQSELGVTDDIEKEFATTPYMCELSGSWPPQRNAAEDKGACIVREVLPSVIALIADEHDSFKFLEATLGGADRGKERADSLGLGGCASGRNRGLARFPPRFSGAPFRMSSGLISTADSPGSCHSGRACVKPLIAH